MPGSDTMGEVRKEASVSSSRVVFSKMDTFLAGPQRAWINITSGSENQVAEGLCAWRFAYVVSFCDKIKGTIWEMSFDSFYT